MNPQKDWLDQLGKIAIGTAGTVYNPIADFTNTLIQHANQSGNNPNSKGNLGNSIKNAIAPTVQTFTSPEAGRAALDVGSFAVPFGKGANIATKALIPGAITGAAFEGSQPDATPSKVIGSAIAGAAIPGALGKIGDIGSNLAGKAEGFGNRVLQAQYSPKPTTASQIDIPTAVGKLANYGFTSLGDVANAHPQVTGANGVITRMTKDAVAQSNPVNLSIIKDPQGKTIGGSIYDVANTLLDQGDFIPEAAANKFRATITSGVKNMAGKGSNIAQADPSQTYAFIQDLEKKAAQYKGNPDIGVQQLAGAYKGLASELKDRLFNQAGADNTVINNVTSNPDYMQELHNISPGLANDVANAKTIGELRSLAAPFVQMGRVADQTLSKNSTKGLSLNNVLSFVGGLGAHNWAGLGLALADSQPGQNLIGKTARGIGNAMQGVSPNLPPLGKNALGQIQARLPVLTNNNEQGNYDSNNSQNHMSDSITPFYQDVKPDAQGHFQLPTEGASLGTFMTEQQREQAEAGMTPGTPEYKKIEQKFAQDQEMAKSQITPGVLQFMKMAPQIQDRANQLYDQTSSIPMGVFNQFDSFNNARKYVDPQYQGFATAIDGLNNGFTQLYQDVTGQKPTENMIVSPKDSTAQAQKKIQYMTNFFAGAYGQYRDAYSATTSPAGILNKTGQPQATNIQPATPTQTDWSNITGGTMPSPPVIQPPAGLPALQ